ncbi:MAG: glycoside hydrolase family 43 protein [Prevotella sp.]|nr:glycoside hydrolase family 43 protein [Prevotella sp.]
MMKEARYLFPHDFMADPSAHVFNDRIYIYPSHDREGTASENDNGDHFDMKDYHCLSLDDPENGQCQDEGMILCIDDIPWGERQLWDSDVVEKNGRYYLVFSLKDRNDIFRLGVAVSDRPEGPFKAEPDPIRGSYSIDPCLFKDDDDEVYCCFGGIWGGQLQWYRDNKLIEFPILPKGTETALQPRIARMTADMLQFAEEPRPIVILDSNHLPMQAENPHHFFEASWMHKRGDKYYFSYSTGDTHMICYAVSDNPYGPFIYQGVLLEPVVGWTSHHSICEFKGKWYLFHHDSVPSGGVTWLRSLKVKGIDYDENGRIIV